MWIRVIYKGTRCSCQNRADSASEQVMSELEKGTLVDIENSFQVGWKVAGEIPAHHSRLTETACSISQR